MYNLAFVEPKISDFPDTLQVEKNEKPFNQFAGKIIRKITIRSLNPFGTNIYDTSAVACSGVGKALNALHINTRKSVIRKNLLVHRGEAIKPEILADNERILRDLSSIDNARIIVTPTGEFSDSVDLIVLVKDVWSIGFDVPTVTTNQIRFRLYDANFLGMNNFLRTNFSVKTKRSPFFRFDGGYYSFININGTFIDASLDFSHADNGDQHILFALNRKFLTNYTRWAGGLNINYYKTTTYFYETRDITTYFNEQNTWIGGSLLQARPPDFVRLIITACANRLNFSSRPLISIDSNRIFYNHLQLLTTISISKNNYYLTDYLFAFGKTENLPYGYLFQITIGKEFSDFYQRFYTGLTIAAGDFFEKVGYFQASVKFGSYVYHGGLEDAVLKINSLYFTPLKTISRSRYRLRSFISSEYKIGINFRNNNRDFYNMNEILKINKIKDSEILKGTQIIMSKLSTVMYTPWYLYGFRFALYGQIQGGMAAGMHQALWKSRFVSGFGAGLIIKNENLVFPNFLIGGYFYPNTPGGINMFQGLMTSSLGLSFSDFNVGPPRIETLGE